MKRLVAVTFTALFCTGCQGCQSPRQPVDPFLGRTTVPPPATGVIGPAGSVAPDSGGFLQRAPATNPANSNQFTPPESNNDLFPPPGINNGLPVGSYPGYQSAAPPPQNTRWARANPSRSSGTPATAASSPAGSASIASRPTTGTIPITAIQPSSAMSPPAAGSTSGNVQLTSGSQPWQPSQTDATASDAAAADSPPVSQIRIVPSSTASESSSGSSDPTDIMNLPPKSSSLARNPATM